MNSINFSVSLVSTYPKWYNPLDNQQTLHLQPKRKEKNLLHSSYINQDTQM